MDSEETTQQILKKVMLLAIIYFVVVELMFKATIMAIIVAVMNLLFGTRRRPGACLRGPSWLSSLPLLGYLPFITAFPHRQFSLLSQTYGHIFKLRLGSNETMVLNDYRLIAKAFKRDEFLGRPKHIAFNVLINLEGLGTLSGPAWQEQKRFTMHQMRNLGLGKCSMEHYILENVNNIVAMIESTQAVQRFVTVRQLFNVKTLSITNLLFGDRKDRENDHAFRRLQDSISSAIAGLGQVSVLTFFPRLARQLAAWSVVPSLRRLRNNFIDVNVYIKDEISKHEQKLKANDELSGQTEAGNYIDCFLMEMRKPVRERRTFTPNMLAGNVQGFLAAGIETTRTTLEWALLILATFDHVQAKVYAEIQAVCPEHEPVSWAHRAKMIYTQATINEIMRWKTISPLNLMRMVTSDVVFEGANIAAGTFVLANLWAVHNDRTYWSEPEHFQPERFIDSEGRLIKHEQFIPFSLGRRSCPGVSLAQMEIFLIFTNLIKQYRLKGCLMNTFDEKLGLTLQPKHPVNVQFIARKHE